jgi:hypothetical protein
MTYQSSFSDAEWGLLVGLPQSVLTAASAAQPDGSRRTAAEGEAGFTAISEGRFAGNPLVAEIATELVSRLGDPEQGEEAPVIEPVDPEGMIADTLRRAEEAHVLLGVRVDDGDAGAYRHWLVEIADQVVTAAQTGGLLGLGGEEITESERLFRDELAAVLND